MLLTEWAAQNALTFNAEERKQIGEDLNEEITHHWYSRYYPNDGEMVQAGETLVILSTRVHKDYIHSLDSLKNPEFMQEWQAGPVFTCFSCKQETVDLDGYVRVQDNHWYCRSCIHSLFPKENPFYDNL